MLARKWGLRDTQHTQETDIHVLSGIRNRDPRNRVAADVRLRAHCQRNRPVFILALLIKDVTYIKFLTMKYSVLFGILFERGHHLYETVCTKVRYVYLLF